MLNSQVKYKIDVFFTFFNQSSSMCAMQASNVQIYREEQTVKVDLWDTRLLLFLSALRLNCSHGWRSEDLICKTWANSAAVFK